MGEGIPPKPAEGRGPPPSVVSGDGRVLAPGVVLRVQGHYDSNHPVSAETDAEMFFDAGILSPGGTGSKYVALGFVIRAVRDGVPQEPFAAQAQLDSPQSHLRQGGIVLPSLTPALRATLHESRLARSIQLWDLVAARLALVVAAQRGFRGRLVGMTDGQQVIEFLEGRDGALGLVAGELDIAPELRSEILEATRRFERVTWRRVERIDNLADPHVRSALGNHRAGFRAGRKVGEIAFDPGPV